MRIVVYTRVSSDSQTIENQERAIRRWNQTGKHEVIEWFREEGETGKTTDRPEFQRMLKFIKNTPNIDELIITKIDRLGRSEALDAAIKEIQALGVEIHTLDIHMRIRPKQSAYEKFTTRTLINATELELDLREERQEEGMARVKESWSQGIPPKAGRLPSGGRYKPPPEEKEGIVRLLVEKCLKGAISSGACSRLLGVHKRTWGRWLKERVFAKKQGWKWDAPANVWRKERAALTYTEFLAVQRRASLGQTIPPTKQVKAWLYGRHN